MMTLMMVLFGCPNAFDTNARLSEALIWLFGEESIPFVFVGAELWSFPRNFLRERKRDMSVLVRSAYGLPEVWLRDGRVPQRGNNES